MNTILQVAIPTPLRKLFDYLVPLDLNASIIPTPGMRVRVPFGSQEKIGFLVGVSDHSDCPLHKLKPAHEILDAEPIFSESTLQLIQWASRYYHASLGDVFETALPNPLRKGRPLTLKPIVDETIKNSILSPTASKPHLNKEQHQAVQIITQALGKFETLVLEGITGSGKTEVYMQAIEETLKQAKQVLVLVPEIGLTPQLLSRLQARFQVPIAVMHSGLTDKKRFEAWQMARLGIAPIVIGTRSSAFVPLKSPGLFIVDEEHDASFKQQEGFRYHARDLIILRASIEHSPVVLGSATPSLETLNNINIGRFRRLRLPTRAGNATPPSVQILDVRHNKLDEGLSAQLIRIMNEHLQQDGQILLFLNRRGFAPVLMCFECGWMAICKQCDAKMTVHHRTHTLQCHHCETSMPLQKSCPTCENHQPLNPVGMGTERLEAALQRHFPDKNCIRLDRDTTRKKGSLQEAIDRIHNQDAHILLGTQMIAKGHDFPNITLVAILDVDQALFSTDFRSMERLGQLITQVAGRAGRAEKLGHVILQTYHPEHPLIIKLLESGYHELSHLLLTERRMAHLPPYSHQALIRADSKTQGKGLQFLNAVKKMIQQQTTQLQVLGPVPAPMERRAGRYRAQLLVQSKNRSTIQTLLNQLIPQIESDPLARNVRWSLDVDPVDMV